MSDAPFRHSKKIRQLPPAQRGMPVDQNLPLTERERQIIRVLSEGITNKEIGRRLGLTDALRAVTDAPGQYSFWDYQAGAWQKNQGLRIDHLLLSPQAADRLVSCEIDPAPRGWEKPSDHVPIFIELNV